MGRARGRGGAERERGGRGIRTPISWRSPALPRPAGFDPNPLNAGRGAGWSSPPTAAPHFQLHGLRGARDAAGLERRQGSGRGAWGQAPGAARGTPGAGSPRSSLPCQSPPPRKFSRTAWSRSALLSSSAPGLLPQPPGVSVGFLGVWTPLGRRRRGTPADLPSGRRKLWLQVRPPARAQGSFLLSATWAAAGRLLHPIPPGYRGPPGEVGRDSRCREGRPPQPW